MGPKIAIIGGGVIGLSCAYQLQKKGASVFVFEKKNIGQGSSYCAAGMITPVSEVKFGEEKLLELFLKSLELYPSFVNEVQTKSKINVDFRDQGSLMVAVDPDDEAELERLFAYQKKLDLEVQALSKAEILALEPMLSPEIQSGLRTTNEYSIDNHALCQALKQSILGLGGQVLENCIVSDMLIKNSKIQGLLIKDEVIKFDQVILATGTDTDFPSLEKEKIPEVRGVKGQALCLKMKDKLHVQHAVRSLHRFPVYLVPRSDGRLIVGASMEELNNNEVTAGQIMDLLYGAWRILPPSYEYEIIETWAGMRPATRSHSPIIGPSEIEGLNFALGMYRHGFLLAAATAELLSDFCLNENISPLMQNFLFQKAEQ